VTARSTTSSAARAPSERSEKTKLSRPYVVAGLRDLEAQARADRAAIERLGCESLAPRRLTTSDDIAASVRLIDDLRSDNSHETRTAPSALARRHHDHGHARRTAPDGFQISGQVSPLGGILDEPGPTTGPVRPGRL
jgi:hypothetical protein